MATKHYCDLCERERDSESLLQVQMRDGVSYHNGDPETRMKDCCIICLRKFQQSFVSTCNRFLNLYFEFDDVHRFIQTGKQKEQ